MIADAAREANRAGEAARREFEAQLRRTDAHIRVNADTAAATAQVAALRAELERLRNTSTNIRVNANTSAAVAQTHVLRDALLALAPAVIPLSAAAAAGAGALAGLGVAGVLAIKGVKAEMKAGTDLGVRYTTQVNSAKTAVTQLERTASAGVLTGFQQSVAKLSAQLPQFNNFVADSSKNLGAIGSHLTGALISGFTTFAPVIEKVEHEFVRLSAAFEKFAGGPAGSQFAQTLADDFDQMVPVIEHVVVAVGRLVAAFAPAGSVILHEIDALASAINAIPVPVLQAAATAFVALKTAALVSTGVGALSTAMIGLGRSSTGLIGTSLGLARIGSALRVVAPYAAAVVGLHFAFDAAATATESWATSSNRLQFAINQTAVAFKDLFSGNVKGALSDVFGDNRDAAESRRNYLLTLNDQINTLRQTATPLSFARAELLTAQDNAYAASLQKIQRANALYATQIRNTPIAEQSALYTKQASSLDALDAKMQKFLKAGDATEFTYRGITVGTQAWTAALAANGNNVAAAQGALQGQIDALYVVGGATEDATTSSVNLSKAVAAAEAKYKLTAAQIDLFSSILGISSDAVANGDITVRQYTQAMGIANRVVQQAGPSFASYLSAIDAFNKSTQTGADKAALFSAALTAAAGDTLNNTTLNLQAASAAEAVANATVKYRDSISSAGVILGQATKTAQGYVITQPKLTEGGLAISSALQQQASSAIAAASALYQSELGMKGQATATKDATGLYMGYRSQLQATLTQVLGNADAAKALTDRYLGVPKNVKTFAKLFGKGDIDGAVRSLTTVLGNFSRIIATAVAKLNTDSFNTHYQDALSKINGLDGRSIKVKISTDGAIPGVPAIPGTGNTNGTGGTGTGSKPRPVPQSARGSASWTQDGKLPPGVSTTGEKGWELVLTDQQGRSQIVEHTMSMAMTGLPDRLPGYAGGSGLPSLVTDPGGGSSSSGGSSGTTASQRGATKAANDLKERLQAAASALSGFRSALGFSASSVRQAEQQWLAAARAAGATASQMTALRRVGDQLVSDFNQRARIQARLGTAPTAPTAYEQLATARQNFKDTRDAIVSAIKAGFDITSAGAISNPVGDSLRSSVLGSFSVTDVAAQPTRRGVVGLGGVSTSTATGKVAGGDVLAQLRKSTLDAQQFVRLLRRLGAEGLPQGLLQQLADAGPSALPQAQALAASRRSSWPRCAPTTAG
jgi:hypothetical protein